MPGYYPPVAPIVPDNESGAGGLVARIVGSADLAGSYLKGFAGTAEANARKRKLEIEQQTLDEKIASDKDKDEMAKAALDARRTVADAHSYYWRTMADAKATQAANGLVGQAQYNEQLQSLQSDATSRANELKLSDPEFQTKNPVEFAANLQKFKDEFGQAPANTGIPARLKEWQTTADQQKTELRLRATLDPDKGWTGGVKKLVPTWQVVKDLQNPDTHLQTIDALKASGHIKEESYQTPGDPKSLPAWQKLANMAGANYAPKPGKATYEKADDFVKTWLEGGKQLDWSHSPSRVPKFVPRGSANTLMKSGQEIYPNGRQGDIQQATEAMQADGSLPGSPSDPPPVEPDLPVSEEPQASIGTPTDTDMIISHARAAIAKGAPLDVVAQRLQGMQIDPSVLWQSAA